MLLEAVELENSVSTTGGWTSLTKSSATQRRVEKTMTTDLATTAPTALDAPRAAFVDKPEALDEPARVPVGLGDLDPEPRASELQEYVSED